jgi:hypothetical protein
MVKGRIEKKWEYSRFIASFNWGDDLLQVVYINGTVPVKEAVWKNMV